MNFNNSQSSPFFNARGNTRPLLPVSNLTLDFDLKIGGYSYLPNTSFKTVLNRIAAELSMASASGANSALSNLAAVAINLSLVPGTSDGAALGSITKQWSDLFLAEGAVINWDNGDATLTQVGNVLTLAGANLVADTITINTSFIPGVSGGVALGSVASMWEDIFFSSGSIINFDNGNVTLTHSVGALTSNVDLLVPDEVYDATAWNGSLEVPTKNAVRDKIESLSGSIVDGTGAANLLAFWTDANTLSSNAEFQISGNNLGIGTVAPTTDKLVISDIVLAGSGSLSGGIINSTQTWNTTGAPTSIKLNVTNTASGAASLLMDLQVDGVSMFKISKGGAVTAATTVTASGTVSGTSLTSSGVITAAGIASIGWSARSLMYSPANGTIRLTNTTGNDFSQLQFGGTTNLFPSLKRSTTILIARLADDSANTDIEVLDDAYAVGWNGSSNVPTKNAIYDKIESLPVLASGTYTPTLFNVTNITTTTAYACQYMRVGSVVTVSGAIGVDAVGAGATEVGISLPIASNLAVDEQCTGTAYSVSIVSEGAAILGDTTNDRAAMTWNTSTGTASKYYFTFTYQII